MDGCVRTESGRDNWIELQKGGEFRGKGRIGRWTGLGGLSEEVWH